MAVYTILFTPSRQPEHTYRYWVITPGPVRPLSSVLCSCVIDEVPTRLFKTLSSNRENHTSAREMIQPEWPI